jgi:hypothetical protein
MPWLAEYAGRSARELEILHGILYDLAMGTIAGSPAETPRLGIRFQPERRTRWRRTVSTGRRMWRSAMYLLIPSPSALTAVPDDLSRTLMAKIGAKDFTK